MFVTQLLGLVALLEDIAKGSHLFHTSTRYGDSWCWLLQSLLPQVLIGYSHI